MFKRRKRWYLCRWRSSNFSSVIAREWRCGFLPVKHASCSYFIHKLLNSKHNAAWQEKSIYIYTTPSVHKAIFQYKSVLRRLTELKIKEKQQDSSYYLLRLSWDLHISKPLSKPLRDAVISERLNLHSHKQAELCSVTGPCKSHRTVSDILWTVMNESTVNLHYKIERHNSYLFLFQN